MVVIRKDGSARETVYALGLLQEPHRDRVRGDAVDEEDDLHLPGADQLRRDGTEVSLIESHKIRVGLRRGDRHHHSPDRGRHLIGKTPDTRTVQHQEDKLAFPAQIDRQRRAAADGQVRPCPA